MIPDGKKTVLYNAGIFGSNFHIDGGRIFDRLTDNEKRMRLENQFFLESYHYVRKGQYAKRIRNDGVKLFLDSGAYTAWTKGEEIDLHEYIDWCHANEDIIAMASVLDKLVSRVEDIPEAVKTTFKNLQVMESRGVKNVLPAYHFLENEEVLEYYANNYSYIAIGGLVGKSTKQLLTWLDRIWGLYLVNADGTPKTKVHGFGITALPAMERYPWASVDSSTWVQWSASGMILMPDKYPGQVNVSDRSSYRKLKDQHLTNFRPSETALLEKEIERWGGDVTRLRELYYARWAWNCWAFPKYLELHSNNGMFSTDFIGLFDDA